MVLVVVDKVLVYIRKFSRDLYFANFSFRNYSRFLEFKNDYLNNLNSYLKLGVFNISENFEFARQRIREYKRKLSSREYIRIYTNIIETICSNCGGLGSDSK